MELETVLTNITNKIVWPILFGSVVIMIIVSGIMFVLATGDPSKLSTARKALIYAVVGLVIGVLAFSVQNIFSGIF
jgi:NAD/NADP transhydrogenase beta subunit